MTNENEEKLRKRVSDLNAETFGLKNKMASLYARIDELERLRESQKGQNVIFLDKISHLEQEVIDLQDDDMGDIMTEKQIVESFDESLDENEGAITVCGLDFTPSNVLKSCDRVAYREYLLAYWSSVCQDNPQYERKGVEYCFKVNEDYNCADCDVIIYGA